MLSAACSVSWRHLANDGHLKGTLLVIIKTWKYAQHRITSTWPNTYDSVAFLSLRAVSSYVDFILAVDHYVIFGKCDVTDAAAAVGDDVIRCAICDRPLGGHYARSPTR